MKQTRGFTLIELAIVLVIITILIGGLAVPLSAQIQARRISETKKTLEEAREAIIGYAMSHNVNISPPTTCTCVYKTNPSAPLDPPTLNAPDDPLDTSDDPDSTCPISLCPATSTTTLTLPITRHYLPCPDLNAADPEPNLDNDGVDGLRDINNGVEDRLDPYSSPSPCAASSGNLPWVTLGTAAQDAWGNRLRYAVTAAFANSSTGFSSTDNGDLQVCSASGCATVNVAGDVPVVLVSHGPNGWGALNVNGSTLKTPTSADELENTNAGDNYVSRFPSKAGDAAGEFDDLVKWISADQLRGRICPSGGCP